MPRKADLPLQYIVRRIGEQTFGDFPIANKQIYQPDDTYAFYREIIATRADHDPMREHTFVVTLNARMCPTGYHVAAIGVVNECMFHPREILRPCIISAAYGFLVVHNHPTGDPAPSSADKSVTAKLREAAAAVDIRLVDHVIIGEPAANRLPYFSFRDAGFI
jgi:DNA repair protein RadC